MNLVFSNLHTCQVRVTVGDSGLCCCTCVTYFECELTPLFVYYNINIIIYTIQLQLVFKTVFRH